MLKPLYKAYRWLMGLLPLGLKKRLLNQGWTWRARYAYTYVYLYILRRTPVVIYQMGKVGSTTIYRSLIAQGTFALQCHSLNPDTIARKKSKAHYPQMYDHWQWIVNHIIRKKRPIKLVTLVREPISNIVSSYFEFNRAIDDFSAATQFMTVDEVAADFSRHTQWLLTRRLGWFDDEMRATLGLDVYATPFDKQKGYGRIIQDNYDMLILKLETSDEVKEQALADFLGLETFSLINANVGEKKAYADLYSRFKQEVKIPQDVLDTAYESHFAQHFYTDEEIKAFRAKWE